MRRTNNLRLLKPGEQYEFDWKFYLIVLAIMGVLSGTFYGVNRRLEYWRGRDVQVLVTTANLASEDNWRKQARNYVAPLARQYQLTASQRSELEEIYYQGLRSWYETWIADRLEGRPESQNRHAQGMQRAAEQAEAYLRKIGKKP
jgi:hypothetical protein